MPVTELGPRRAKLVDTIRKSAETPLLSNTTGTANREPESVFSLAETLLARSPSHLSGDQSIFQAEVRLNLRTDKRGSGKSSQAPSQADLLARDQLRAHRIGSKRGLGHPARSTLPPYVLLAKQLRNRRSIDTDIARGRYRR